MRPAALFLPLLLGSCQPRLTPTASVAAPTATRSVPDAPLRETRWVLRQLAGQPVAVPAATAEAFLLLRPDSTAEGNGSCNRFRGRFFSKKPGELAFGPLMSTRMSCPAIGTESAFIKALGQGRTYRISGDTLRLLDAANAPLARLEAVYLR